MQGKSRRPATLPAQTQSPEIFFAGRLKCKESMDGSKDRAEEYEGGEKRKTTRNPYVFVKVYNNYVLEPCIRPPHIHHLSPYLPIPSSFSDLSSFEQQILSKLSTSEAALYSAIAANATAAENVCQSRAGFNNWNCKPTVEHPRPLVLVHGTTVNLFDNWVYFRPRSVAEGYCVFALSYGELNSVPFVYGLDKMENSSGQLQDFIDRVLEATGTTQGTILPRYYMKFLGGATKVHKFAGIAPLNYGSTINNATPLLMRLKLWDEATKALNLACIPCTQVDEHGELMSNLNAGGDTVPGVEYLMIVTKTDELVTPYTSGFLRDKSPNVHNQVLQNWCESGHSEHIALILDPIVFKGVHAFFTPSADQNAKSCSRWPSVRVKCSTHTEKILRPEEVSAMAEGWDDDDSAEINALARFGLFASKATEVVAPKTTQVVAPKTTQVLAPKTKQALTPETTQAFTPKAKKTTIKLHW
ncbi:hypothetical protein BGZ96_000480 [Linnemannia gamsii]|uniref:Uncharacterized protein n=1 Tax=Linnemannia gamsii TaxID=64522 RepID=A0ABQ7JP13_9FUNG|nr:hypothetical protein BGZ96_000480 [Linnemannia gamsii]